MPFDTSLLDQALRERRDRNEAQRQLVLARVQRWLVEDGPCFSIDRAYIFGSVLCPYRFHERSDVDMGINPLPPDPFFTAMGSLSEAVERDVDLVELFKHPARQHFYTRICEQGVLWTPPRA